MGVLACTIIWINIIIIRAGTIDMSEQEKKEFWERLKPELTSRQVEKTDKE
jgi:hypothetical protein